MDRIPESRQQLGKDALAGTAGAPGTSTIGFLPGERVVMQSSPDFLSVEVAVTPAALGTLAGEASERLLRRVDAAQCFELIARNTRVLDTATKVATLMAQPAGSRLRLHATVLELLNRQLAMPGQQTGSGRRISAAEHEQLILARELLLDDLNAPPAIPALAQRVA